LKSKISNFQTFQTPGAHKNLLVIDITLGCPAPWTRIENHCYKVSDDVPLATWAEAKSVCEQVQGSQLVTLMTPTQFTALESLSPHGWIGLNSIGSLLNGPLVYSNIDGSPVVYTPWSSQIANPTNNTNCVATVNWLPRGIAAYDCDEKRSFACMLPLLPLENLIPSDCIKPPHDNGCRVWGTAWKSSCFYMGNEPSATLGARRFVSFDEARTFCQEQYNADLATINTAEQQDFLTSVLGLWAADYWIGLRGNGNPWNAFKTWVTGTSVTITNWGHGQPNPSQPTDGCVALHGIRSDLNLPGDWYVESCDVLKFALCEGPREGYTPPTIQTTAYPTGCPMGWNSTNESQNCYKVVYSCDKVNPCMHTQSAS
jgi:hypothetical protein